jgi:lycopene beta-cyclase
VDSHPFDVNKMLFMDWRDSHLQGDKLLMEGNLKLPTFLYAMPFSANHIFLGQFTCCIEKSDSFVVNFLISK